MLPPSFFDSPIWKETRRYTSVEAVVDLCYLIDTNTKQEKMYTTSMSLLSKRWNWGRTSVTRFVQQLKTYNIFFIQEGIKGTVFSLNPINNNEMKQTKVKSKIHKPESKKTLLSAMDVTDSSNSEIFKATIAFKELFLFHAQMLHLPTEKIETADSSWIDSVFKIVSEDRFTVENLRTVYIYLKSNSFWKSKIFDTKKLRAKFQILLANANADRLTEKNKIDQSNKEIDDIISRNSIPNKPNST